VKLTTIFIYSVLLIGSSVPAQATDVGIKLFQFQPGDIAVKAGETVTWLNGDDIEHSVTAGKPGKESGVFDSDFFKKGGSYNFTFNEAGTFEYFCKRHPSMKAKITVTQ
jgi:plastocyanin